MSGAVIRVERIGKRYRVGERERYTALRDVLARAFRAPFRRDANPGGEQQVSRVARKSGTPLGMTGRVGGNGAARQDWIWALKDVTFEVKQGEVVGLVGRNGAGKSTLLKVLSRITKPTEGYAEVHGRVGSLLEVGTGFHPELTGRENIFLNGAILGMRKAEIARKFDQIAAFAEIERFLDTPVKYYSSGMYVRLAFAVAAHLEMEILFVDEVLAVGDGSFQKKCLGRMGEVSREGRTIVFVSHNMAAIRRLCHRALWIDKGETRIDGSAHEVVSAYEAAMARGNRRDNEGRNSVSQTRFLSWEIANSVMDNPHELNHLGPVTIRFFAETERAIRRPTQGIALYDHDQQLIWSRAPEKCVLDRGRYSLEYTFAMLPLRPGLYTWRVALVEDGVVVDDWYCEPEMIVSTESYQTPFDQWVGILNMPSAFSFRADTSSASDRVDDGSGRPPA